MSYYWLREKQTNNYGKPGEEENEQEEGIINKKNCKGRV